MIRLPGTSLVYENFELYNPIVSLEMIVWSLCAGLSIGAAFSFINNRIIGDYVRRLIKDGIHTPDSAKTLAESGFSRNFFVRWALRDAKPLRRLIKCANEDEMPVRKVDKDGTKDIRMDMNTARFYIPEDLRITAELRYEERGNSLMNLILSILLLIALALVVLFIMPELLQLMDNFMTMMG